MDIGEDVPEWFDFSNASPWETFVSEIEESLRGWGLQDTACTRGSMPGVVPNIYERDNSEKPDDNVSSSKNSGDVGPNRSSQSSSVFSDVPLFANNFTSIDKGKKNPARSPIYQDSLFYDGVKYNLSLHEYPSMPTRHPDCPTSIPMVGLWLLNSEADFEQSSHRLTRWFGVREFIILDISADSISNHSVNFLGTAPSLTESKANFLLSAIRAALLSCNVCLPAFIPIGDANRGYYIGTCPPGQSHGGSDIRFRTDIKYVLFFFQF